MWCRKPDRDDVGDRIMDSGYAALLPIRCESLREICRQVMHPGAHGPTSEVTYPSLEAMAINGYCVSMKGWLAILGPQSGQSQRIWSTGETSSGRIFDIEHVMIRRIRLCEETALIRSMEGHAERDVKTAFLPKRVTRRSRTNVNNVETYANVLKLPC